MPTDLAALDHAHVWHPFTPMRQWRQRDPLIIQRGDGPYLFDTAGHQYIDGVSSLWCNVHGHNHPHINQAIRDQLDQVAHTTLLGLASPPSIQLAARLTETVNRHLKPTAERSEASDDLTKVFYSDAGATAVEVAFKMAVGYWHHSGQPDKTRFIGLHGAYHGDTVGSMSVGFSNLFHRPFVSMVFQVDSFPHCDPLRESLRPPGRGSRGPSDTWPSEDQPLMQRLADHALQQLATHLDHHAHTTAAVVLEPVMQGAAGMIVQPPGFVRRVRQLCTDHDVLLIADEVATGFGRTDALFACEHDRTAPDILCLAKGLTGGYLPLAVTLATDRIAHAFEGQPHERRTLYHGHTYTGNPLACAAALACLDLFTQPPTPDLLHHITQSTTILRDRLDPLRTHPGILDVRQRGLMVGIELGDRSQPAPDFDFAATAAAELCHQMRARGVILRPLGNVLVLMPIPATPHPVLHELLDTLLDTLTPWRPTP
jgi:adenosylmethionine-8-amino-7-oxononanoate aminotransferase